MKAILSHLAGSILCIGLTLAQNHAAEFDRICPNTQTTQTREVELSTGFYATYHCNKRPQIGQNANLGKLAANTPEECIQACKSQPGCGQVAWVSGQAAGCYGARSSGIDIHQGSLIITYREDCQKQNQPVVDKLNQDLQSTDAQLQQCLKDKQNTAASLTNCQNALNACQKKPSPNPNWGPNNLDPANGQCNQNNNGKIVTVGGKRYKISYNTAGKQQGFYVSWWTEPSFAKQGTIENCLAVCNNWKGTTGAPGRYCVGASLAASTGTCFVAQTNTPSQRGAEQPTNDFCVMQLL
ncbi:hypothetical protein BDV40DRAFT_294390 [Aspergillus tamarii]|uniref:Apple domain-containing protein n=1 Tax=Aspergillus tamarii TaxID=41984 RepID=A0A5N6VBN0_ASPTM|nr:hypothetical protein BDV40DRAFT_294390 [Aspergillus tamarii]